MTDPIADMLTRIKNGAKAKKEKVYVPFSKLKLELAKILKREGYISDIIEIKPDTEGYKFGGFEIVLKYDGKEPAISGIKKISKSGQRHYVKKDNLPVVLNNYGIAVLSTSQGLMSNKQAKKLGLGGEVLCEIY